MDRLEEELGEDDYNKVKRDIKKALLEKKEEFHETEFQSVRVAKTKLMTLVTEIMIDEAGFFIDGILEDCTRKVDLLEIERSLLEKYQYNLKIKTSRCIEFKRDADAARKKTRKGSSRENNK